MFNPTKRIFVFFIILGFLSLANPKRSKPSKNDIEKIKKGLFLDSYMLSQNELFYNNSNSLKEMTEKLKEENLARKLSEDEITLTNLGFFPTILDMPGELFGHITIFLIILTKTQQNIFYILIHLLIKQNMKMIRLWNILKIKVDFLL